MMKTNTFPHSRWRRFGFAELVLLEQDSVVIGARNLEDILMARIANPRQLIMIITNH